MARRAEGIVTWREKARLKQAGLACREVADALRVVLGFGNALGELVDPKRDDVGLQLDEARLPKRVRVKQAPTSL